MTPALLYLALACAFTGLLWRPTSSIACTSADGPTRSAIPSGRRRLRRGRGA